MTDAKIQTNYPIEPPVRYDDRASQLVDAQGYAWLDVDALEYDDRDICVAMVQQMANALNRQSELEAEVKVLREAMKSVVVARCRDLHHSSYDLHSFHENCPVEKRFNEALAAADTARGKAELETPKGKEME